MPVQHSVECVAEPSSVYHATRVVPLVSREVVGTPEGPRDYDYFTQQLVGLEDTRRIVSHANDLEQGVASEQEIESQRFRGGAETPKGFAKIRLSRLVLALLGDVVSVAHRTDRKYRAVVGIELVHLVVDREQRLARVDGWLADLHNEALLQRHDDSEVCGRRARTEERQRLPEQFVRLRVFAPIAEQVGELDTRVVAREAGCVGSALENSERRAERTLRLLVITLRAQEGPETYERDCHVGMALSVHFLPDFERFTA